MLLSFATVLLTGCEKEDTEVYMNTGIAYTLTLSPDLLKFVSPEVTYVDSEGDIHTISGVEELDSIVNIGYAAAPGNTTIFLQKIDGTNYKCWTLNMRFDKCPFHSFINVRYRKLDIIEDTTGVVYDFHHSIYSTAVVATATLKLESKYDWWYGTITTLTFNSLGLVTNHITFTKNSYYRGQDVDVYINDLINNPDIKGYDISEDGDFSENDEILIL